MDNMENKKADVASETLNVSIDSSKVIKFIIFAAIGIFMFLTPIPVNGAFSITTAHLSDWIIATAGDFLLYFTVAFLVVTAIITLWTSICKPKVIVENRVLASWFVTSPVYLISRIIGAIFIVMCVFNVGPECIISEATGQTIVGIANPLVATVLAVVFFMPFLTDFGLMEFIGVMCRKVTRPLFTLPGRATMDVLASWLGAANAAVILTRTQYDNNQYTKREAAVIMTAFSAVNIPFCLVVTETIGITEYFLPCYATVCIVGIVLAVITPRIYPLSKFPNTYKSSDRQLSDEMVPEGVKASKWALKMATDRTKEFDIKRILQNGSEMLVSILVGTIPIVFAWGIIALIIVEYTPFFDWISYPFGFYMDVLGVEYAFDAAPAALAGFVDMFIPALLVINIPSVATKWILGTLSLVQIIFMTEVGILAVQSKVGLNIKNLFIIFLERTIIAIPLIVLAANLIF